MEPAEIVNEDSEPLIQRQRGRKPLYPWNEWLRHNTTVRLTEGVHFDCRPNSIRQQAFNQAANRHGTITTKMGEDFAGNAVLELTFQFRPAYLARQEKIRIEGDKAMGIHEEIKTGAIQNEMRVIDEFETASERRQKELDTHAIDDPRARNGQKWGPPTE